MNGAVAKIGQRRRVVAPFFNRFGGSNPPRSTK